MNRRYGNESKGQLLVTAVLFTLGTLMWIYMAVQANANAESYTSMALTSTAAIVVLGVVISGTFWYRWFTYDRNHKK